MTPKPWIFEVRSSDDPKNNNGGWGTFGLWGADNTLILGDAQGWGSYMSSPSAEDGRIIESAPEMFDIVERLSNLYCPSNGPLGDLAIEAGKLIAKIQTSS